MQVSFGSGKNIPKKRVFRWNHEIYRDPRKKNIKPTNILKEISKMYNSKSNNIDESISQFVKVV